MSIFGALALFFAGMAIDDWLSSYSAFKKTEEERYRAWKEKEGRG